MYKRCVCTSQNNEKSTAHRNPGSNEDYLCQVNQLQLQQEVKQTSTNLYSWLVGRFDGIGLQQLESLFHQHRILVNGVPAQKEHAIKPGDMVEIHRRFVSEIIPEKLHIDILYEDDMLLVVNKPAGMPVHPGLGHYRGTLLNALAHYYEEGQQSNVLLREAVVHRLDKDTSGILVLAKSTTAKKQLESQFRQGTIHRVYQALVWGIVHANEGLIDLPVGRVPGESHLIAADPSASWGKMAMTRYKTEERLHNQTWLTLYPETGRTHQLRIHLHAIGHPIVGDKRYKLEQYPTSQRLHLHAKVLKFLHPDGHRQMEIDCPFILDK